jgi:head-tail adaptor
VKLRHTVVIERATAGTADDYNQPAQTFAPIATVQALIQPKSGTERAQLNEAGVVRGQYRVFMPITDVVEGDHLVHGDEVYELTFVADAAGAGHHLEIDAERVWP